MINLRTKVASSLMQRGAASRYRHYGDVFREIIRKDGMRGLYCGIVPEYAKVRFLSLCCDQSLSTTPTVHVLKILHNMASCSCARVLRVKVALS